MSKKASNPCAITGGVHAPMLRVTRGPVTPAMAAFNMIVSANASGSGWL